MKTLYELTPRFWRIALENALSFLALYLLFQLSWWVIHQLYPSPGTPGPDLLFTLGLFLLWLSLSFFVTRYEVRYWRIALQEGELEGQALRRITGPAKGMATAGYPLDDLDLARTLAGRKTGLRGWLTDTLIWSKMGQAVRLRRRYFTGEQAAAFWRKLEEPFE